MATKGIEFLRNLKPKDMPFTGEIYERLKDYLIIKRVSDEKYYEDYKRLIFTMQISEFEESLIKFHISVVPDGTEVRIYSMINDQWVSILDNNEVFRKYYAKSDFRNSKRWYKYIDQVGITKCTVAEKNISKYGRISIYNLVSLYISESLNFYGDPVYLYKKFKFNGFDREHINYTFSYVKILYGHGIDSYLNSNISKEVSFIKNSYFDSVCNSYPFFSLKDINTYMNDLSIELLDTNSSAINDKIMKIDKKYINYRKIFILIAEINVNKIFFKNKY